LDILALNTNEPEYAIETESLGRIDILPLTISRMKTLEGIEQASGAEFVASLLAAIGRKEDDSEVAKEEASRLTDAEKKCFAEEFLEHNQHLYRERVTKRRQNEKGETVVSFEDGEVEHPRQEDETAPDYLLRVFKCYLEQQNERMRKMMGPYENTLAAHKKMFTPSFIQSLKETQSSQARLQDMVKQMRPRLPDHVGIGAKGALESNAARSAIHVQPLHIPDLKLPENPIHDTNRNLREVVDRLEEMNELAFQTAETVGSVSNSATEFLVAFGAASDSADRASRGATRIATAAIIVAVASTLVQMGYAEWRTHQNQIATDQTVNEILMRMEDMVAAQRANTQQLSDRMDEDNQAIADSMDRVTTAIGELLVSLRPPEAPPTDPATPPEGAR
jgi:hypothetical protein